MANSVLDWVWKCSRSRNGARLVLLSLADSTNQPHGWTWPSVPELMSRTGLKDRAVAGAIKELADMGELEVQYNAGPKGCNRYRVLMTPAKSAGVQNLRPAKSAGGSGDASPQVSGQNPADNAPPADTAGPQYSTPDPAESAPGTVREPKNSSTKSSSRKRRDLNEGREDAGRLCAHLADRIEANGSLRPVISKKWLDDARLMLDTDKRTEEQVHKAIDWCQDSEFWRSNVMEMGKLRKKYDQLRLKALEQVKAEREAAAKQNGNGRSHSAYANPEDDAVYDRKY